MLNALKSLFRPAPITGRIPTEPVMYRFEALVDFWSPEVSSQYLTGSQYSVRVGNKRLDALAKSWAAEHKVKLI